MSIKSKQAQFRPVLQDKATEHLPHSNSIITI